MELQKHKFWILKWHNTITKEFEPDALNIFCATYKCMIATQKFCSFWKPYLLSNITPKEPKISLVTEFHQL